MDKSLKNWTNRTVDRRRLFVATVGTYPGMRGGPGYRLKVSAKQERCKIKSGGPSSGQPTTRNGHFGLRLDSGQETPLRGNCWDIPGWTWGVPAQYLTVR